MHKIKSVVRIYVKKNYIKLKVEGSKYCNNIHKHYFISFQFTYYIEIKKPNKTKVMCVTQNANSK